MKNFETRINQKSPEMHMKTKILSSPSPIKINKEKTFTPFKNFKSSLNLNLFQSLRGNRSKENINQEMTSIRENLASVLPSIKVKIQSPVKSKTINVNSSKNEFLPKIKKSPSKLDKINDNQDNVSPSKDKDSAFFREKYLYVINMFKQYVIIPGNNSTLVKNCFSHRSAWRESQNNSTLLFNLKWQQNIVGIDFGSMNKIPSIKKVNICNFRLLIILNFTIKFRTS